MGEPRNSVHVGVLANRFIVKRPERPTTRMVRCIRLVQRPFRGPIAWYVDSWFCAVPAKGRDAGAQSVIAFLGAPTTFGVLLGVNFRALTG